MNILTLIKASWVMLGNIFITNSFKLKSSQEFKEFKEFKEEIYNLKIPNYIDDKINLSQDINKIINSLNVAINERLNND